MAATQQEGISRTSENHYLQSFQSLGSTAVFEYNYWGSKHPVNSNSNSNNSTNITNITNITSIENPGLLN
jgi:hypothetical protein